MDYISRVTDEELCMICDLIPLKHFRDFFKKNPKKFNKLSKYRPERVPLTEVKRIAVNRGRNQFISDVLNSLIQLLLNVVQDQVTLFINAGEDAHIALLHALPESDFREHLDLYFKLSGDVYSSEYAELAQSAIAAIKASVTIEDTAEKPAGNEASSTELEHLQNALAEMQQDLEQERNTRENLQAQCGAMQEQREESERKLAELQRLAFYADSSASIPIDEEFPFTSLCRVGISSGSSLELYRMADIVDGLIQTQRQDGFPQRDVLYTKDFSKPKDYIGIWAWRTEPNYNPERLDYIVSEFLASHTPVQIIVVPDCRTPEELKEYLRQGIAHTPTGERALYALAVDGEYTGLLCRKSDLTEEKWNCHIKIKCNSSSSV